MFGRKSNKNFFLTCRKSVLITDIIRFHFTTVSDNSNVKKKIYIKQKSIALVIALAISFHLSFAFVLISLAF